MARPVAHATEFEPIDRLEEKVKLLVGMIDRLKNEHSRATDENAKLNRELEALRARLAAAEAATAELSSLREEREAIRDRVVDMLQQLEALHL